MTSLAKLMLSSILITLIVLGLSSPVMAQALPPPIIYVDAPSSVGVSTEFDVIIWIRDLPAGWGLIDFSLRVSWDPNDLEYIECEFLTDDKPVWGGSCSSTSPGLVVGGGDGPRWTEDAAWFRIRFHCLREGPAPITVSEPFAGSTELEDLAGGFANPAVEPVTVTVNQVAPVGGVVTAASKLTIIAPYLVLAGVVAVASAIYIKRRKH